MLLKDDFGNTAEIQAVFMYPYKGARLERAYRLRLQADYDNGFTYFLSIYSSVKDALIALRQFSCGTFKIERTY